MNRGCRLADDGCLPIDQVGWRGLLSAAWTAECGMESGNRRDFGIDDRLETAYTASLQRALFRLTERRRFRSAPEPSVLRLAVLELTQSAHACASNVRTVLTCYQQYPSYL